MSFGDPPAPPSLSVLRVPKMLPKLARGLLTFARRALCEGDAPARNAASSAMAEPASAAASKSTALDRASSDRRRGAKMSRLMSRANMCAVVRSSELVYMSDPSLVAGGEPPKPTSPPVLG